MFPAQFQLDFYVLQSKPLITLSSTVSTSCSWWATKSHSNSLCRFVESQGLRWPKTNREINLSILGAALFIHLQVRFDKSVKWLICRRNTNSSILVYTSDCGGVPPDISLQISMPIMSVLQRKKWALQASQLARLPESVSPGFRWETLPKYRRWRWSGKIPKVNSECTYVHAHYTHTCKHTNTNVQKSKDRNIIFVNCGRIEKYGKSMRKIVTYNSIHFFFVESGNVWGVFFSSCFV